MWREDYDAHSEEMKQYIEKYILYECPVQKTCSEYRLLAVSGQYAMVSAYGGHPGVVHVSSCDPVSPERQQEIDEEYAEWVIEREAEEEERERMKDPAYRMQKIQKATALEMSQLLDKEDWL